MAIAEIKWKLVKDTYFFDTTTCYLSEDGNHMFYSGGEKRIEILIDDLNELVRKGCAMWLKVGEYEFALDKLSKCSAQTWHSINQMLYSLEPWGVMKESKKSTRKSLKEDSLDDIIPMGHSEYFDTLIEFLKDKDVPFRISHTASGGKICYVENDIDFISVIFKSPKRGYELLKMIEMYGDGSVYLSRKMGSAWYSNHVPLNEIYVWDMDKDEFVNYKGKVLKNITYDDIVESKKSARNSIKESSDVTDKIASEIDKSYWINKLIDDLDKHYESMEKAWLKNLDKLSDEDILGIVDDCMGKSKTLVGKSEMLKNKMIDDLSKAYDDYIDDIDRQIRIGKSEDEIKDMIETTLENDIKMYLKLAYNNKASSNYFMVKFAEDNLI